MNSRSSRAFQKGALDPITTVALVLISLAVLGLLAGLPAVLGWLLGPLSRDGPWLLIPLWMLLNWLTGGGGWA